MLAFLKNKTDQSKYFITIKTNFKKPNLPEEEFMFCIHLKHKFASCGDDIY